MWPIFLILVTVEIFFSLTSGHLVPTPPMGWLAWTKFLCETNCKQKPKHCISENLFREMADVMVKEGYRDAGYTRVNIDDCWGTKQRDTDGRLIPDPKRFPKGIPWLASYMHENGMKLGIYTNNGKKTCMGFAGTQMEDMETDAKTFAEWGVDMLKMDGCFVPTDHFDESYPLMAAKLNETKREIVFSCSWPYYVLTLKQQIHPNSRIIPFKPDYSKIMAHCNLWRNFDDIQLNWQSVKRIINYYDAHQDTLSKFHGPGHWNDPDMLIVGNRELTIDQAKTQMGLWCIWSAPLLMSNDLRDIEEPYKKILLNSDLIAVNQDPLGIMGTKIAQDGKIRIYMKPMTPVIDSGDGKEYSYAIAFFNEDPVSPADISISLKTLGLTRSTLGYLTRDLYSGKDYGLMELDTVTRLRINPDAIVVWKATVSGGMRKLYIPDQDGRLQLFFVFLSIIAAAFFCRRGLRRTCSRFRFG